MRMILVGYGVVGQNFSKLLSIRKKELISKYGLNPRIIAVVDRQGTIVDHKGLDPDEILRIKLGKGTIASKGTGKANTFDLIRSLDAEIMVETTPTDIRTAEPGLSHIETAIKAKKQVITTNKGPLALALPALLELARHNKTNLLFSGAVGGGTPILTFGRKCLSVDKIVAIHGILNGTTNFILTKMENENMDFRTALKLAQQMGFAEKNPSLDIDGLDTACKIVILANWLMRMEVTLKDVNVQGIRRVGKDEIIKAKNQGFSIKLIGSINGGLQVKTEMVRKNDPLCVHGNLNAIKFISEFAGEEVLVGKGAGGLETASAILRDLLEIRERIS